MCDDAGMNDFDRRPGAIDDPGLKGGIDPRAGQPADRAAAPATPGGRGEPAAAELDLPGPDDPVAWSYVEADTLVVGRDGEELGRVAAMLGTETEGIFHGIAVDIVPRRTDRVVLGRCGHAAHALAGGDLPDGGRARRWPSVPRRSSAEPADPLAARTMPR